MFLKRNISLEASWLPGLVGALDGLPDLASTDYTWTLWDAVLRYDPAAGGTLQAFGKLRYKAGETIEAPDLAAESSAAFMITWIPDLGDSVPPYTLRLDARAPAQ